MIRVAKFNLGDIVTHVRQAYRAVVVDIDPSFFASGRYNPQANKRGFSHRNPWYRLLVDNSSQITYVEECFLIADDFQQSMIDNPNIERYFVKRGNGYLSNIIRH